MADIEKLKQLIATDSRFKGLSPDEIFAIGSIEDRPIPVPPVKTALTTWEAASLGDVTLADVQAALAPPPKQMRSPDGAPGSWHAQPEGKQFRLYWDMKPQPDAPLFDSEAEAEAWMKQWYADHPPVEVKEAVDVAEITPAEIAKP